MHPTIERQPFPPCPAPFNMAEHVLRAGLAAPEKTALLVVAPEGEMTRWSHGDLRRRVLGAASGLIGSGLEPGDRVLMRLGNTPDFPVAYLGALAAGLVPVPTSSALTEAETAVILADLEPNAVLRDPAVACAEGGPTIPLDALRASYDLPAADFHMGAPDRPGYVIYTSGTSGRPRAVVHAHRAIWARQMMFDGWYRLRADDRVLHAGAFNWTYTLGTGLMDPWTAGATAVIPAPGTDVSALPDLMRRHGATIFAAAPGIYRQMLERAGDLVIPSLRHGLSAGEKLAERVAEGWRARSGREVYEAYGMSECSTFVSQPAGAPVVSGTLGRPQPGRRVALLREGQAVARGEAGTIAVHRDDPGLMLGYLEPDGSLALPLEGDWFLTGDQGAEDVSGHIRYLGRNDDMMNAGGFRVSPLEVEAVLAGMPGVQAVAATEVSVKADTRVIAAFYVAGAPLDESDWRAYVRDKLARYKQPRLYIHLPSLPQGANGKILRRALRAQFESSHDRHD